MKCLRNNISLFSMLLLIIVSCNSETKEDNKENSEQPAFCDCVNHDYHNEGDKEKCDKIEADLKKKLETASKEERGEILMQIKDCKVQGQYDND